MLPLGDTTQLTTQLTRGEKDGDEIRVEIHSRSATGAWIRHAVAKVEVGQSESTGPRRLASSEPGTVVSPADLYSALRNTGLHHGQAFAALTRIVRRSNGTSETEIVLPDEATGHRGYRIHPVLLDAALQGLAAALSSESLAESSEATYLPVSFEKIRVFGDVGRRARCRAELVNLDGDGAGIMGRVLITDDTGTPTAEISGIYLHRVQRRTVPMPLTQKIFDTEWVETPDHAGGSAAGRQLAGADRRRRSRGGWPRNSSPDSAHRRDGCITADLSTSRRCWRPSRKPRETPSSRRSASSSSPGRQTFDGTDSGDGPARGRDLTWGGRVDGAHDPRRVARQVAATVVGLPRRAGRRRRRAGRPVDRRPDRVGPGSRLRAPGPAHHAGGSAGDADDPADTD